MKKLNRKGFTLVELLAVIVILAIVVGITIPAILNTIQRSKEKAFQTASETAADWFERQYQLYLVDPGSDSVIIDISNFDQLGTEKVKMFYDQPTIEAAGLKFSNVEEMTVHIKSNGRVCVDLVAKDGGDYYGVANNNTVSGGNCGSSQNNGGEDANGGEGDTPGGNDLRP